MSQRVDPGILTELKTYGAVGIEKCFNCGNCTAICPLTSEDHLFPRDMIRYAQVGLRDRLLSSTDPWLCYYCGDCTRTCPKGAEPAETMMAMRRWQTAQYDQSGHSAKLYTSEREVWKAILRTSLLPLVLLLIYHIVTGFSNIITDRVALNAFAPVLWVWAVVLIHFAQLGYRLVRNGLVMIKHVTSQPEYNHKEGASIPLSVYLQEFKTLLLHGLTQKRWLDCGEDRTRWFKHLILITGYASMLVLIVGLLWWFQTDNLYPIYHPQRWVGYLATILLMYASGEALIGRFRKREEIHRFSHPTDWLFPSFIFIGAVTGILVHIFRYVAWPWPTYAMYTIHVMAMVAMLDTEVGIGKWTHLIYRPLAMYLEGVKERIAELPSALPAPAGAD
jgi:heterodisulfide reductase subunit C